eukprot:scaffold8428_cov151-Skeletonema_menzelii.AAC.3
MPMYHIRIDRPHESRVTSHKSQVWYFDSSYVAHESSFFLLLPLIISFLISHYVAATNVDYSIFNQAEAEAFNK